MTATSLPPPPAPLGLAPGLPATDRHAPGPDAGTLAVANAALRGRLALLARTLLHPPGPSRAANLLSAVSRSRAGRRGPCSPGHPRPQADLGCGINKVPKSLREPEAAGLVTRRRGLGRTTLSPPHDPPPPPAVEPRLLAPGP